MTMASTKTCSRRGDNRAEHTVDSVADPTPDGAWLVARLRHARLRGAEVQMSCHAQDSRATGYESTLAASCAVADEEYPPVTRAGDGKDGGGVEPEAAPAPLKCGKEVLLRERLQSNPQHAISLVASQRHFPPSMIHGRATTRTAAGHSDLLGEWPVVLVGIGEEDEVFQRDGGCADGQLELGLQFPKAQDEGTRRFCSSLQGRYHQMAVEANAIACFSPAPISASCDILELHIQFHSPKWSSSGLRLCGSQRRMALSWAPWESHSQAARWLKRWGRTRTCRQRST